MSAREYRHRLTAEQRRMTDRELVATLPPGQSLAVREYGPYWVVAMRQGEQGQPEYIVLDTSRPGLKPVRVHGPTTKTEALSWAHLTALLFAATHGQVDL